MAVRLLLVLLLSSSFSWAQNQCENLFADHQLMLDRKSAVDQDFMDTYRSEVEGKTAAEVADMNLKMIDILQKEVPIITNSSRASEISAATAEKMISLTYENPVVNPGLKKYDPNHNIGFCFGRATFIHLMLLKLGVQKNSIRKIWAIGPMNTGEINWRYHVATLVYTEKGWLVLDTNHGHAVSPKEWVETYSKMSTDGKLRFYISDASKFGFSNGKYSRLQLGLDAQEQDYYRGYFKNMFAWLKTKEVNEYGVRSYKGRKSADEKTINDSFADLWRSVVEFMR